MDSVNKRQSANTQKRFRPRFSLRHFILACLLVGITTGLIALQQQRQGRFLQIVDFVERSFDSGAIMPNKIAERAASQYTQINGNQWVSSVSHSAKNGPAFISSEHELIYRPSARGNRIADITIVTTWHVLESHPTIQIKSGDGEFDEIPLQWLRQRLRKNLALNQSWTQPPDNNVMHRNPACVRY